jgi:hypothetical protein
VCKTTIFYADKMVQRVSRGQNNNADFEITESLCLAINNIDYVLQYIQPFVNVSACLWKDNGRKKRRSVVIPEYLCLGPGLRRNTDRLGEPQWRHGGGQLQVSFLPAYQ